MPRLDRWIWLVLAVAQLLAPGHAAQAGSGGCGPDIEGLSTLLRPAQTVLFGEIHGTAEVPRFVGDVACRGAAAGLAVVLALEAPADEDPAFERYLASKGSAADRERLLSGQFWRSPADGRSSRALVDLLEQMRKLRVLRTQVTVRGLIEGDTGRDGDRGMAHRLLALRRQQSRALLLGLAGNNHTRVGPWPGVNSPSTRSMGEHLRDAKLPDVISLNMAASGGTFFGVAGDQGVHDFQGTDRGRRRFVQLSREQTPFDGEFYVGPVTASVPAVSGVTPARGRAP